MSSALAAASLILKPEGYSEGRLQTLKPIEKLGSELVTNGTFDTNSDWTFIGSANIANGVANFTATSEYIVQNNAIPLSVKTYKIQYEVVSSNNGQLRFAGGSSAFPTTTLPSSVGVHTVTAVSNGTKGSLQFNSNGFVGSIDNVSVKEVLVDGGDFTFTRGSNLSATRVNSAGLIEKGRENLLLQSNQFDTTWTGETRTGGFEGYDGSNDAWKITKGAQPYTSIQQTTSLSGVWTLSAYLKSDTLNDVSFRNQSDGTRCDFDLLNGVAGFSGSNVISKNITDVGNGWYRCQATITGSSSQIAIYVAWNDATIGSVFIQDAQLEAGMVATDYIETGASTVKAGILENTPRLDYSGGATEPSLLLEPSRTNVWEYSEYLDYSFDSVSSVTTTQNTTETLSPEGLYNATKLEGVGSWSLRDFIGGTGTGTWTISCYVKAVNASSNNTFRLSVGGNNYSSNLTATSEWQRFEFTFTNGNQSACGLLRDSSTNDAGLYIYGAQVEEGSYPTSYIPTYGSSVTRSADSLSKYDLTDSTSQTIFFQFKNVGYAGGGGEIVIEKANPVAAIFRIYSQATAGGVVLVQFRTEFPVQTYTFNTGKQTSEVQKVAFSISGTTAKAYCNGQLRHTFTITETEMQVLNWRVQNTKYSTDELLLFPTALSDADCITLTTL